ncbi:MAG: protein kinase [Sideroxydans sp.]|nr:protein kinase [Sideroxydans sp.]
MQNRIIDRFNIIRELGRGVQGTVYLAQDTQLDRQVAIKTLRAGPSQDAANLIREAKIASKLQHPNIVTLHDAFVHEDVPYLVYAFIQGQTLAQLLKQEKMLPLARSAQIASGVLEGLAYAHRQGVMHLDIKPANIMIQDNGQSMVMDFGIARAISQRAAQAAEISGTPQYMAPERISAHGSEPRSDLYSVGMMLYEMVTGTAAISGDNVYQILHQSAHGKTDAPSSRNLKVDEKLETIILKAISKQPDERYPDAASMRQALQQYLDATAQEHAAAGSGHSTLEFLLRRMRSKSDFPALSGIINEINKVVGSELESTSKLTQIILKDFALTNKLLKVVNTVSYGQFGGKINTISKAVVILGFETVRNMAMTLILLDFLQNKSQAVELKDEIIFSLFSGTVAAELAPAQRPGFSEEAMICSMFHHLGKLLVTFYFFEESQQITRLVEEQDIDDEQAAVKVLGLSYNELSIGVAKSWNFPSQMISAMRKLPQGKISKPANGLDQLNVTVNLANELSQLAAITNPSEKENALHRLSARYADVSSVSERSLTKALDKGLQELAQRSVILGINTTKSPLLAKVRKWAGHEELPAAATNAQEAAAEQEQALEQEITADSVAATDSTAEQPQPEDLLNAGIQDVTNTLVEDYNLNDVLRMVLETIYRSLGFNRTLIFIRDGKQNMMVARFGFGEHIDEVIPRCRFSLKFAPDVFHLAVEKGTDIVIEDVQAENIASKIPAWHREAIDAQSLLLLPIMINNKAIGLLYADMLQAHSLHLTQRQLAMLRTLRNQAVLAIKQKI